jgi:hypothetical protein
MAVAKVKAVWCETTSHEAILEIPDAPPEGPVTDLQILAAVQAYRAVTGRSSFIGDDHVQVEGCELLRAGSTAEVTG